MRDQLSPVRDSRGEGKALFAPDDHQRLETVKRAALSIAATTSDAIICADGSGVITFWNKAAERLFGYTRHETVGRLLDAIAPDVGNARRAGMARVREGGELNPIGDKLEAMGRRKTGHEVPIELSLALWREDDSVHFAAIIRDATERRESDEQLRHLAYCDQLTGMPNRTMLKIRLEAAIEKQGAAALLFIDLDGFKDINDVMGHSVGDELLMAVGWALERCVNRDATVARVGGDEFAIILPGCGDPVKASHAARRVLNVFARPIEIEGRALHIGASIGVALYPSLCADAEDLMASADLALHTAKREGGAQSQFFFPALREQVAARRSLEDELRRAFAQGELEVFYQPQVRLSDHVLVGAEALVRWRHPERGLLSPALFLPVLESSALSGPVGEWILREACGFAASLIKTRLPPIRMGVNLFTAQFAAGSLTTSVRHALEISALPPDLLELEITENTVLKAHEAMISPLRELRAAGVNIAFDDYGTGYASLSLLKRYPLTRLKIDRDFVRDVASDPDDAAIVRAVLAMGANLGLEVIAEGVENAEQEAFLAANGCQEGQGYLYGTPMPERDFLELADRQALAA